jgi:hypothetical protein
MKIGFMSGQQLCLFVKQHLAPYIFGLVNQLLANEWGGLMCVGPAAGSIKSSAQQGPLTHTPPPSSLASDAPGYFSNIFKREAPPLSPPSSGIGKDEIGLCCFLCATYDHGTSTPGD